MRNRIWNRYNVLAFTGAALIFSGVGLNLHGGFPFDFSTVFFIVGALLFLAVLPLLHFTLMKPLSTLQKEMMVFSRECLVDETGDDGGMQCIAGGLRRIHEKVDKATFRAQELEATVNVYAIEKQQMETILRSLPIAVLVTDRFDELIMANDVAQRLLGFQGDASQGRGIGEVLEWTALVDLIKGTSDRRVKVPRRMVELNYEKEEDDPRVMRVILSGITDHSDQILGVVTIIQDATKDREIDRMKSEFVANVSHELKAPLSAIKAYTEMLLDGEAEDEEARQGFFAIIDSETDRLSNMIDNLLDLSRLEAGVIQLNMERVNLIEMLKSIEETMRPSAEKKSTTIHTDISQYIVPVEGDRDQLNRVLVNLISNAIKYTPEGGRIDLTARLEGDLNRIDVTDTGYGIPEESLSKIFEKFYRVKENSKFAKGTGMGLAMVKRILDIHHAEIKVKSKPGEGSCFSIFIPAAK